MAKRKVKDPLSLFRKKRKKAASGSARTEKLIQDDPDLKSFVYQQIAEFQPGEGGEAAEQQCARVAAQGV